MNCSTVHFFCGVQSFQQWTAPAWTSLEVMGFFRHSHVLQCGVPDRLQLGFCSAVKLHGLQRLSQLSHQRLKGNLCSDVPPYLLPRCTWCPHSCSFHIPFLSKSKKVAQQDFPLLNMLSQRQFHRR